MDFVIEQYKTEHQLPEDAMFLSYVNDAFLR